MINQIHLYDVRSNFSFLNQYWPVFILSTINKYTQTIFSKKHNFPLNQNFIISRGTLYNQNGLFLWHCTKRIIYDNSNNDIIIYNNSNNNDNNDIKLLAKNEKEQETDTNNKNIQPGYRNGICYQLCSWWKVGRWITEGIEETNPERIRMLGGKKNYKILGMLEADTIK